MTSLLVGNNRACLTYNKPGVANWSTAFAMFPPSMALHDRSGKLTMPFGTATLPKFALPVIEGSEKTFAECCDLRAQEIITGTNKPIALMYSGGIDSTVAFVALAKAMTPAQFKERVTVYLSNESVVEYPEFYFNHIRRNCTMRSSEDFNSVLNGQYVVVGGEHGDQMFGSTIVGNFARSCGFNALHDPYARENIIPFLQTRGVSNAGAHFWFNVLDNHARNAPCEVITVANFFWWLNFIFKWQTVYFLMLLRTNKANRHVITEDFCNTLYQQFFSSTDFQIWAMRNPDKRMKDSWNTYKFPAKDYIFEYTGDQRYRDEKLKLGSFSHLLYHKDTAQGLTNDFQFIDRIDPVEFYVSDNSFV